MLEVINPGLFEDLQNHRETRVRSPRDLYTDGASRDRKENAEKGRAVQAEHNQLIKVQWQYKKMDLDDQQMYD